MVKKVIKVRKSTICFMIVSLLTLSLIGTKCILYWIDKLVELRWIPNKLYTIFCLVVQKGNWRVLDKNWKSGDGWLVFVLYYLKYLTLLCRHSFCLGLYYAGLPMCRLVFFSILFHCTLHLAINIIILYY